MQRGIQPPSIDQANRFRVNRPGEVEVIRQPLYDYQAYAAGGQTSLSFFQLPIGQASKTKDDTNMESAGQLPNPKSFLIDSIELVFFPGGTVGSFGAQATPDNINDVQAFMEGGTLELFVGSKTYLTDAPLGRFPQASFRMGIGAAAADNTTPAADLQTLVDYAVVSGPVHAITPIKLESNQNFVVNLTWNAAVALPSGVAGRVGVVLNGFMYRLSQ